jgi:3-oxoacyl-[acyl-carrier protein] reductase
MAEERKKIALFGSAAGFGKSLALAFAQPGNELFLFDREPSGIQVVEEIHAQGAAAKFQALDVSDVSALEKVVPAVLANHAVDGLVYLPRAREERDFRRTDVGSWDRDLNIGVRGAFFAVKSALPYFKESPEAKPFILFVSSILSEVIGLESVGYHVAKAGLDQLTRYLAVQLGPKNIRVNCVQIGIAVKDQTQFRSNTNPNRDLFLRSHPLRRVGTTQDISNAALFLASEAAQFITGQVLCVDGGLTLQEPVHFVSRLRTEEGT